MAFFGNLGSFVVGLLSSSEGTSGDAVTVVSTSQYVKIPILTREDSLVLYGPTKSNRYELLLQQSVEHSQTSAFSLFRISDGADAQVRFINLKNILLPLIEAIPSKILTNASLQTICDLSRENSTWTVAHIAAYSGYVQALTHPQISRMIDTAEIELKCTPLHLALKKNDIVMCKALIEMGVSVDTTDVKGNSVFHLAAITNDKIIQLITSRNSTLLNAQNNAGKTPLHLACEADKSECVKALLIAGADVNVAATHDASLPIHSAINANSTMCAKEIILMYPNQLNVEDMKHGGTPLHWATSREMINALVEFGCRFNGGNFQGSTALHNMVKHNRLQCVVALLSWNVEVNLRNKLGNTPLHLASSPPVVQALLVFGADPSICNNMGENTRHTISTSSYKDKNAMLYILHAVGAPRCCNNTATCNLGCSPAGRYDGVPPETNTTSRLRTHYDEFLDDALCNLNPSIGFALPQERGGRVLCLDGGGMKGLVLIQLLMVMQRMTNRPLKSLFDWVCGTSTGGILALAVAMGKSPNYCQGLYLRMKDAVFVGQRPYDEKPLENILKKEFGENTYMSDIKGVKVVVTGVLADRFPADLHLFRNFLGGEELLNTNRGISNLPIFPPTLAPDKQLVWQAARASGAAPSYFKAYGRFIDGGLISNNPTLDIMTDIAEYNTVLSAIGEQTKREDIRVVVSLGTGKLPVSKVDAIDMFRPESLFKTVQMVFGLSNMFKLLIDQATMADNSSVDRARAWCGMCGISYLRLSPQLTIDVALDETKDEVLVNMLWETLLYAHTKKNSIEAILKLLTNCINDVMVVD